MKTKTWRKLAGMGLACLLTLASAHKLNAQEAPITLITKTSTAYYSDGSSRSRSTMLFEVEGVQGEQPLGFMGRRLAEHLNPNPAVQQKFKAYKTLYVTSLATGVGFTAALLQSVFRDETPPMDVQEAGVVAEIWWGYKWPIVTGVAYLTTGVLAGSNLTAAVELHNGLVSDGGENDGFGALPSGVLEAGLLQANAHSPGGLGLRIKF